jgi:ABC-type protease/lipase transport system fused ATPase/permease subunit
MVKDSVCHAMHAVHASSCKLLLVWAMHGYTDSCYVSWIPLYVLVLMLLLHLLLLLLLAGCLLGLLVQPQWLLQHNGRSEHRDDREAVRNSVHGEARKGSRSRAGHVLGRLMLLL